MTKRLHVVLDDAELEEIERAAAQKSMTVDEGVEGKLLAVRAAMAHSYPTGDVGQINAEIERGRTATSKQPVEERRI
jgi:hypothetical protein